MAETAPHQARWNRPRHLARSMAAAVACSLTLSTAAVADIADWGEVDGWFVAVDTTFSPRSCFAAAEFDGETYLRIGIDASDATVYAVLANPHWLSLEAGGTYGVEMWFGDETPWGFAMHAGQFPDGSLFLISFTDDWLLLEEFAGETNVRVVYDGRDVANLDLSGSPAALAEIMECQRAMDEDTPLAGGESGTAAPPAAVPFEDEERAPLPISLR